MQREDDTRFSEASPVLLLFTMQSRVSFCYQFYTLRWKYMNHWIQLSIEYANQRNYLDELFRVYPTIPEGCRDINPDYWENVGKYFNERERIVNLLRNY